MNNQTAFAAPDLPAGKAGGIQKLRELILTLAMQGKLVLQYPNDSPESGLLKKIKKPQKLPPIKLEEVPYELSEGWEWENGKKIPLKFAKASFKNFCARMVKQGKWDHDQI